MGMNGGFFKVLTAIWVIATMAMAQVAINATNFPDPNFRAYVSELVDGRNVITPAEIANITNINVFRRNISNLKGIEHFTALQSLNAGDNRLTELDMSKNIALTFLRADNNRLTEINLSNNIELDTLLVGINTNLSNVDVSNNVALSKLQINNGSELTEIDISNNVALTDLWISGAPLTKLDVSNNIALVRLQLSNNQLREIDLSNNIMLRTLEINYNQLTRLDVSNNTALTSLECANNLLTELHINAALRWLDCHNNYLSEDILPLRPIGAEFWRVFPQNEDIPPTYISNIQKSDNRYGIRFAQNIVSDRAEISVVLPNNERVAEMRVIVYDMTGNVVFVGAIPRGCPIIWDLRNNAGRFVANGTYLVIAEVKDRSGKVYRYSARLGVKR